MKLPQDVKELYPFKSHFFKTKAGHKLHYIDEGEGPQIVFVHGNPTWSFFYRNLIKYFSQTHRVLCLDHLGCGLSEKPQKESYRLQQHIDHFNQWLEFLKVKHAIFVAHDWGGAITLGHLVDHPDLCEKLVLFNTAAFRSRNIPKRIGLCKTPWLGQILVRRFNLFAFPATFMASQRRLTKAEKRGYLLPYNNYSNRIANYRFVQDIPLSSTHPSYQLLSSIEDKLKRIKSPKLILWGGKDFCFDLTFYRKWQEFYPEANYKLYEDAGHYLIEDKTQEVITDIENFTRAI